MEPVTTAVAVAAVTALAQKVAEGAAGKIGEDGWNKAKAGFEKLRALLGLKSDPASPSLEGEARAMLDHRPELRPQVQAIVNNTLTSMRTVVGGSIHANKVVVAENLNVDGPFQM